MEFDYYGAKAVASWLNPKFCAYCAGASGVDGIIDEDLTLEWRSALSICPTCLVDGARPLFRTPRRNADVHERRAQRAPLVNSDALRIPDEGKEQVPMEARARGKATSFVGLPSKGPRVYRRRRRRR